MPDSPIDQRTAIEGSKVKTDSPIEAIAKLAVMVIGVAYAVGFLVVLTFLDRYGIKETAGDLFRLRYIYIGALCISCPAGLLAIVFTLFLPQHSLLLEERASSFRDLIRRIIHATEIPSPVIIIIANLIFVLYCIVVFARPGMFAKEHLLINTLYGLYAGALSLRFYFGREGRNKRTENVITWCLAVASLVVTRVVVRDIEIVSMWRDGIYNYLVIQSLFIAVVYRFAKVDMMPTQRRERQARWGLRIISAGGTFILGVFSFAHTVYPHIPAGKGGGDFSNVGDAMVCFVETQKASIPVGLIIDTRLPLCSVPVKIIEVTPTDIYVARSSDRGGYSQKEFPDAAVLWRSGRYYPVVFDLSRSIVSTTVILNDGSVEVSRDRFPDSTLAPPREGKAVPAGPPSKPASSPAKRQMH